MFPSSFFAPRYFAPRYFPSVGAAPAEPAPVAGGAQQVVAGIQPGPDPSDDQELGIQAYLNDVPVLHTRPVRWRLAEGVLPVIEAFDVRPQDVAGLVGNRQSRLTIRVRNKEHVFRNLLILDQIPGPNEHIATVRVTDRRWSWQYAHVVARFNMRRKVGFKRAKDPGAPGNNFRNVQEEYQFAKWSLKDGKDK